MKGRFVCCKKTKPSTPSIIQEPSMSLRKQALCSSYSK